MNAARAAQAARAARPAARDAVIDRSFAALADPTRRAIVRALVQRQHRAGELAERLRASAPALSRHLRVLREAGLVHDLAIDDDARVRLYELAPQALAPLRHWLDELEAMWGEQLQAFKAFAESAAARGRATGAVLPTAAPGKPRRRR
ncbi:MAG: winged helix-turn-helix transcriptional regulator [Rubrivivax sp.]|nr:winged helix-turn-helix transcriptional regulator [Rubrivivax sp.]